MRRRPDSGTADGGRSEGSAPPCPPAGIAVRRTGPADWPTWRRLRLAALEETPQAFCEVLSEAAGLPDEAWRARVVSGHNLLAEIDGRPCGMASVHRDDDGVPNLVMVYVTPSERGTASVDALVGAAVECAADWGASRIILWCHEDGARARRAYGRLGFRETGRTDPHPSQPGLLLEMVSDLR